MRIIQGETAQDDVLIARFQKGDACAFDLIMESHMDKIYALAWGVLYNREDAMDATQEVFIKLHRSLHKFPSGNNLSAWLYRVCLNHCIDRKRRAKRSAVEMTDADWERLRGPMSDEPEYTAHQRETGRIIRQAVDLLPERQRLVFILRHYKLLSINEIADTIGCTPGAVKAHLSRATGNLRNRLRGTVVFQAVEVDE